MRRSLLALVTRAATMAVATVCGVLTTRLVIGDAGVEQYALYTLLLALPALLSFTDLGSGAAVVNSLSTHDDYRRDRLVTAQVAAVSRIQLGFAAVVMLLNVGLLVTGGWAGLLGAAGDLPHAVPVAFGSLTLFCLGVPLLVWTRIQLGLRRNHVIILVQGLVSPLTLLLVWVLVRAAPVDERVLPLAPFVASLVATAIGFALTVHHTRPLMVRAAWVLLPRRAGPRHAQGPVRAGVMEIGWPMLAQLLSPPLALSTQRLVLAHWGTSAQVAEYGVAGQVFLALQGLVVAAGTALWPINARRRQQGRLERGPARQAAVFGTAAAVAVLVVWAIGPQLFGFTGRGQVDVGTGTILGFGAMVVATAVLFPLGMFIMDTPGVRFQVVPTLAMAFGSLGLAIAATPFLGVAGPPAAYATAVLLCQIVPFSLYIRRHRARLLGGGDAVPEPRLPEPDSQMKHADG